MTLVDVLTVVLVRRQCVAVSALAAERADDVAAASVATEVRHDVALIHICADATESCLSLVLAQSKSKLHSEIRSKHQDKNQ